MTPTPTTSAEAGDAVKLEPCPFCGGSANYVKHSAGVAGTMGFDRWDAVACRSCGATAGACDRRFRTKGDAATAWNRRALSAQAERVRVLEEVLRLAVLQNSHDMLMTGDEIRQCEFALSSTTGSAALSTNTEGGGNAD